MIGERAARNSRIAGRWHARIFKPDDPPPVVAAALKDVRRRQLTADTRPASIHRTPDLLKAWAAQSIDATKYARSRAANVELADYIRANLSMAAGWFVRGDHFAAIANRLDACRRSGCWGHLPATGQRVTMWDDKCGLARLCPAEANQESKRVARRYVPLIAAAIERGQFVRYAVFTLPNAAPRQLARTKKALFRRFRALMRATKKGRNPHGLAGALVIQEDPMGAAGDWNVHLNAILIFDTWPRYRELRDAWHWNVELRRIGRSEDMAALFRELVKTIRYSGKAATDAGGSAGQGAASGDPDAHGLTGSADTRAGAWSAGGVYTLPDGRPAAPPMTRWPPERWAEWARAQRGFRRTRTYGRRGAPGSLFAAPQPEPERLNEADIEWAGRLIWHAGGQPAAGRYEVTVPRLAHLLDLIPGDKSTTQRRGVQESTGPPPASWSRGDLGRGPPPVEFAGQ